jgi:hypothetical protein
MITLTLGYGHGRIVTRKVYGSQAQGIVDAMRADGVKVTIAANPTAYIVK